jgi:uncharacterized OsmC-like protein
MVTSNRSLMAGAATVIALAVALGVPGAFDAAGAAGAATTTTTAPAVTTAGSRSTAPKTLLAASLAAAGTQTSVHYVATSSVGTRSLEITADASTTAGTQSIVLREGKTTGHVTGRFVDKIVYFRGDTVGLEDYLGMPATLAPKYNGQWISFSSTTKDYSSIAKSLTLSAAIAQISVSAPLTGGGHTIVDGKAAVGLRGTTTALSSKGKKGSATLYVSAKGSPLPVAYRGTGKQKKQKETGTVTFSRWGETVSPAVPAKSVAASTIS